MPLITQTTDGGHVESWLDTSGGPQVLRVQKFDASGQKIGAALSFSDHVQGQYDVAALPGGGYAVVWQASSPGGSWGQLSVQDAGGATIGQGSTGAGRNFHITAGSTGDLLVSYLGIPSDSRLDSWQPLLTLYDASGHALNKGGHLQLPGQITSITPASGGVFDVTWNDGGQARTMVLDPATAGQLSTPATPRVGVIDDTGAVTTVPAGGTTHDTTPTFQVFVTRPGEVFIELDKDTGAGSVHYDNQGGGIPVTQADVDRGYINVTLPTSGDGHYYAVTRVADATGSASYPVFTDFVLQTWQSASARAEPLTGTPGNDTFAAPAGGSIDGGAGWDQVNFSGPRSAYLVTVQSDGSRVVTDQRLGSPDGATALHHVEAIGFSDGTVVIGPNSAADAVDLGFSLVLRQGAATASDQGFHDALAAQAASGALSIDDVARQVVAHGAASTSVATLAYEFFTGAAPSAAGMDYLVNPAGPNPNNLNSAYYQGFSLENRYINFAANLGRGGEGAAQFNATYANLTPEQAIARAYETIFGGAPSADKVDHLLHDLVPDGQGASYSRLDYFEAYGGDGPNGIGTKAAMVGWLLAEAVKADVGTYARSNDAFLSDVALHDASFGVDIVGHYGQAGFAFNPG